jgi:hypothetical protein
MNWSEQLKNVQNNLYVSNYFTANNLNLEDFLNNYIKVDQIICKNCEPTTSELSNLLKNLQTQNDNIQLLVKNVQIDFSSYKIHLENSLRSITNNEIKDVVSQLLDKNSDKQFLENISDKLVNLNSQNLNEFDRKTLSVIQNMQSAFSTSLDSHHITHKINDMDCILTSLHNKFNNNSSRKGEFAENILFSNLVQAFPDSDVILTRFESDAADIQIKKDNKPLVLIDSKHIESKNVPKPDLEKFHENCKINNASGILCNAFSGIANKKHFEIDIIDKNIIVYIWNHEFDATLFQVAVRIIYNIYDIIKEQKTDKIQIDQILYKKLKLEYNFFLQNYQQHINSIKTNIKSLEQLTLNQLEQFFKRSNFNCEDKQYSCELCGTGFVQEKYLKDHVKKIHNITLTTSRRGRKKKDPLLVKTIDIENIEDVNTEDTPIKVKVEESIEPVSNIITFS